MKNILTLFFSLFLALASAQVTLQIQDVDFEAGDTVSADVRTFGFVNIAVFQKTMRWDTAQLDFVGLEFTGELPLLNSGDFSWYGLPGYNLQHGEMRCVYAVIYGETLEDNTHIYSVVFVAKTSGSLSSSFWLWDKFPVKPMAYTQQLQNVGLEVVYTAEQGLAATGEENPVQPKIYPNPFSDSFTVEFDGECDSVSLFYLTGKQAWSANAQYSNLARFEVDNNFAPGVYVLRVSKGGATSQTKIVKQ